MTAVKKVEKEEVKVIEKETEKIMKIAKEIPSSVSSLPPNKTPEHGLPSAGNTAVDNKKVEIKAVTPTVTPAFGGGFDAFDLDDKGGNDNSFDAPTVTIQKVRVVSVCPCSSLFCVYVTVDSTSSFSPYHSLSHRSEERRVGKECCR